MRKVHVGCGYERFPGWENYDAELDIAKPLPFENESVDYMFSNHMLEHVTQQEGYRFLQEAYRVIKKGGCLRVGVPDVKRMLLMSSIPHVQGYITERGGSIKVAIENVIFSFGHKAIYTADLLDALLRNIGFTTIAANQWDKSPFAEFYPALDDHHKDDVLWIETSVIDAFKSA